MIDKKWRLFFTRDGGWYGSAECNTMTAKIKIDTYNDSNSRYPTFEDAYAVLEAKIKMHEEAKTP